MPGDNVFDRAVRAVLEHEGRSSRHPADRGGPTRYGIASRAHADVDIDTLTEDAAIGIYRERYWRGPGIDRLPDDGVAAMMLDAAVLHGPARAVAMLQRALRSCGSQVVVDGLIGPETIRACGEVVGGGKRDELMIAIRRERAMHVAGIVCHDVSQVVFLRGWLRRILS